MAHYYDEEAMSVFDYTGGAGGDGEVSGVSGLPEEFVREIEAAQRVAIMRNHADHVRGALPPCSVNERKVTLEKQFSAPSLFTWTGDKPDDLIAALRTRRVRARLQANMGVGKSTKLGPLLASELDRRVLVIGPNAHALRQNSEYVRAMGIGRYSRHSSRKVAARVNCMTYMDFIGELIGDTPAHLFQQYDILIFDEAFEGVAMVYAALRAFAVYATPEVSMICCSATISPDASAGGSAGQVGAFTLKSFRSLEDMMDDGKLVADYLVDRTYLVLPTDDEVTAAEEYYTGHGVDVLRLDSASDYAEFSAVLAALAGDAVTARVVLMHYRWALGFNMGVEFGIVRPFRAAWVDVGGKWAEKQFPMTEQYVSQAKSRTGRGLSDSSSGMVVGKEREEATQLYESSAMEAFVILHALSIKPGKSSWWAPCYALFPEGLPPSVAHTLMKVNLPVEIVAKFLGPDGLVASRFTRALSMFTQNDHYLAASKSADPASFAEWVEDTWKLAEGLEVQQVVPVHATGELQCALHGIVAMAEGKVELERWRPTSLPPIGDYDSDDGLVVPVTRRLRRPVSRVLPPVPEPPALLETGYRFPSEPSSVAERRVGRVYEPDRLREAFLLLDKKLATGVEPVSVLQPVETEAGTVVEVPAYGVINSPGGTALCTLPASLCHAMNEGKLLTTLELLTFLAAVRGKEHEVVGSVLFDFHGGPWLSYLKSFCTDRILSEIIKQGEMPVAAKFLEKLRFRFDYELVSVIGQSNVTKSLFRQLFGLKVAPIELLRSIRQGSFKRVAQSRRFFDRTIEIDNLLVDCLRAVERRGMFMPHAVSHAQRVALRDGMSDLGGRRRGSHVRGASDVMVNDTDQLSRLAERFRLTSDKRRSG